MFLRGANVTGSSMCVDSNMPKFLLPTGQASTLPMSSTQASFIAELLAIEGRIDELSAYVRGAMARAQAAERVQSNPVATAAVAAVTPAIVPTPPSSSQARSAPAPQAVAKVREVVSSREAAPSGSVISTAAQNYRKQRAESASYIDDAGSAVSAWTTGVSRGDLLG